MSAAEIVLIVLGVLALIAVSLWSVAQRLDRLHRREYQTRATLEGQLNRRAQAISDFVMSPALDPASAVLIADALSAARQAPLLVGEDEDRHGSDHISTGQHTRATDEVGPSRDLAESDLSAAVRAVLATSPTTESTPSSTPASTMGLAPETISSAGWKAKRTSPAI